MSPTVTLFVYLCIFVGTLIAFEGLIQTLGIRRGRTERAINRRLHMLASGADPEDVLRLLRRQQDPEGLHRLPWIRDWPALVGQSGLSLRPDLALAAMLLLTLMLYGLLHVLAGPLAALPGALGLGIALPVGLLRLRRHRRRLELSRQLPDAIDLMVQSLRVGHPLNVAFQLIAREMPDPIGTELGIVSDAITYGDDLTTAIEELAVRVGTESFNYLAVAINIQHSTGGNVATVLETLSRVMRDRFAMERKIRAMSAEGRITAIVVSVAPAAMALFLHLTTPTYYREVIDDPLFLPLTGTGLLLATANALVLRRLVSFHF